MKKNLEKFFKECVIITGARGKIGANFVRFLLKNGYNVFGISREVIDESEIVLDSRSHGNFYQYQVDLTKQNSTDLIISSIKNFHLSPIGIINNARDIKNLKVNSDGSSNRINFQKEYLLNVVVPYELSLGLFRNFKSLRSVINVGSIYGSVAMNRNLYTDKYDTAPIHYGIAKAALIQLTKELAVRFSERKVAVNCLSFGGVAGRVDKSFEQRYSKLCPYGQMLTEDDLLHHVLYLLHPDFVGMTGQNLIVDGGWTVW